MREPEHWAPITPARARPTRERNGFRGRLAELMKMAVHRHMRSGGRGTGNTAQLGAPEESRGHTGRRGEASALSSQEGITRKIT